MPLPLGHPYKFKVPTIDNDTILYLDLGASNAGGAATGTEFQPYNTNRNLIYKHNDTIVGFSDPPNNQSVTTYSRLDETMTQNRSSFLGELMRETTRKKVCVINAYQSATGITNQATGFNSPTTLSQITSLCSAAKAKVGKQIKFALVNVTDGDARFNTTTAQMGAAFNSFCSNLRTATGNPDLYIIMVGLGATPPSFGATAEGGDNTYPSWTSHREYFKWDYKAEYGDDKFYYCLTDDLDISTYVESDEIHWNALGHKVIAGRILHILKAIGIVPYEDVITFAGEGQSLTGQLWNSTESGSNAGITQVKSQIQDNFPKHRIDDYAGYNGGSAVAFSSNNIEYWWDEVNDTYGVELIRFLEDCNADNKRLDIIHDDIGHDDAHVIDKTGEVTGAQWKEYKKKIYDVFRLVWPNVKILRRPMHRRAAFSNTGGYQTIREKEKELISENSWIYENAEMYDLALFDNVHNTDAAIAIEAPRTGRRASQILGASVSGSTVGLSVLSAVIDGINITVQLSLDGGTGFAPTTNIQGFKFFDDGIEIPIASTTGDGIQTINIVLDNAPTGSEQVLYYGHDAMLDITDLTKIVRDNSAQQLPLRTANIAI